MARPFVSVLIDTYNHERFIEQAVVSVLEQNFSRADREIIVVDDGSTDRTPEILRKFERELRVIRKANGGQASAFNAGIPECRGDIVAFLDGDDWWEKTKVGEISEVFQRNQEFGTVGHGFNEADESGRRTVVNVPNNTYTCKLKSLEEARQFIGLRSFLGTSRLAIRKTILQEITHIPEQLVVEADEFIATIAVAISGCVVLPNALTCYRLHSGNLYQSADFDESKIYRKFIALDCLTKELPSLLAVRGVPRAAIEVLTCANRIDATRSRLAIGRGHNWETVRVERLAFRQAYRDASFAYRLFHAVVLTLASVLPPPLFYRLRHWYDRRRIAQFRKYVAEAIPVESLVVRKSLL